MGRMKHSCDEEIAYSLTEPFVVYFIKINQSEYSLLLSGGINQCAPLLSHNTYLWPCCYLLVTRVWCTCDPLVIHLWPTYDPLWPYCYSLVTVYVWNPIQKLRKILLKIAWSSLKNCVKCYWKLREFSQKLCEIFSKIAWYSLKR